MGDRGWNTRGEGGRCLLDAGMKMALLTGGGIAVVGIMTRIVVVAMAVVIMVLMIVASVVVVVVMIVVVVVVVVMVGTGIANDEEGKFCGSG